jgi:outer membrane receptor protein involved in Fe transport
MKPAFLLSLFVVSLVWVPAAKAADLPVAGQADEAQFHFLRGNHAYQEKRFEDALASYYLSNRLVANRNVQFNIARCLDRLGRYDESYRAWSTLLAQALPEKELQAAQDAIEQLRPHLALLEIETTPPGATIYAGRRDLGALGTTPKSLALRPGLTKILLDREGYRPVELAAEPARGQQVKLSAVLERIYGEIDIRRVPADAEIRRDFLDGEVLRHGPGAVKVVPGQLVLFISAPGFQSERVLVNALPDATVPVDVLMSPAVEPTGTLVVRANITGALIRVDGKEAGFSPAVVEGVPVGIRQIEILAQGRRTFLDKIEVRKGERAFVDAHLGHADPEVTAATKSSISAEDAPAAITVITADEIAALGYTSLAQALTAVRGVFASNDRSYESVGFRGFSPPGDYTNRVLVLVDGHPINDAATGQGYVGHDFDVDLANVARIEVVRGPGSVLYGTGALFGVINVVTRQAQEGAHASANTIVGSSNLISGRATASMRKGDAELLVSAAALSFAGDQRYLWPADANGNQPIVLDGDGEHATHAALVGHWGSFSLRAGFNDRQKTLPTGAYVTNPSAGTSNRDRRAFAELAYEGNLLGARLAARAAYDGSWYHGRFDLADSSDGLSSEDIQAQWGTGEVRLELPSFLRQRLTLGTEAIVQFQMDVGDPNLRKDRIFSAYVVDHVRLSSRLHLDLGLRADDYSRSAGATASPRIAVVGKPYQQGNTKLFFGRSYRIPSANERATSFESLRPEVIWSGELEHSHAITDDIHVVAALFANWLSDLVIITPDQTQPGSGSTVYVNQTDRVRSLGAEGELRWEPGGGALLSIAITRQRVETLSATGDTPFLNAPDTLFQARVIYPVLGPTLRWGSEVVLDSGRHFRADPQTPSDNRTEDAFLCNMVLSGDYRTYHLHYSVGVFNLFDIHDVRAGFPTSVDYPPTLIPRYGRSMRASLALAF